MIEMDRISDNHPKAEKARAWAYGKLFAMAHHRLPVLTIIEDIDEYL